MIASYRTLSHTTATLLRRAGASGLADTVTALFRRAEEKPDTFRAYGDLYHEFVEAIANTGQLKRSHYTKLRRLKRQIQTDIQQTLSVDAPTGDTDRRVLQALHYMGGLTILGSYDAVSFFVFPETLTISLRLLTTLGKTDRKKHVREIAAIRSQELDLEQLDNLESDCLSTTGDALQATFKSAIVREFSNLRVSSADLEYLAVEYLPTACDFYFSGVRYYKKPEFERNKYYIFSTTSGIVLPEEKAGSSFWDTSIPIPALFDASQKNPFRESYFESLGGASKRDRYYFFEWDRTSSAFQSTLAQIRQHSPHPDRDAQLYRDLAVASVDSFLRKRRFGLFGVQKFPEEYRYFTLGNGRAALLSGRDPNRHDSIGHGFMLHLQDDFTRGLDLNFIQSSLMKLLPKSATYGANHFVSGLVSGILSIAFRGLRNLTARQRAERVVEFGARIQDQIRDGNIVFDQFTLPDSRKLRTRKTAERIVAQLEQ